MSPAIALAILLASHSDRNVTGLTGFVPVSVPTIVVVVERPAPKSVQAPAAPLLFNYGDHLGRFPILVQLTGDVRIVK